MVKTVRVTIRLPEADVDTIDTFVDAGESRDRTDFIRRAIKAYVRSMTPEVTKAIQEQQQLAAALAQAKAALSQKEQMDRQVDRLATK